MNLPLLAVWTPFPKVLSMIYAWRVNRILYHPFRFREMNGNVNGRG